MAGFLGKLPLCKTARRFCLEALYGIATRQSVRLSEIARSLNEEIALIKTENRLSRQAGRPGLAERVMEFVIGRCAPRIKDKTLLIVDPSDIAKPYAEKMEYLARVRDGSKKELADGYWLLQIVGAECGGQEIVPLVNHLWSQDAPGFRSENAEIRRWVKAVARATRRRGIWVVDRGGDRRRLYEAFLRWRLGFIVRLVGNRDLICGARTRLAREIAAHCPLPYAEVVVRQNGNGTETRLTLEFGFRQVRLPGWEERPLWLLVIKGFGEEPLMLLTTIPLRRDRKTLWWAVEAYLTRWRIEDTLRFAKQSYHLEDVRVLGYRSLQNMMAMALLAMHFTMVELGRQTRLAVLCHHALRAAKRLFGIPEFCYYAIADGLRAICAGRQAPPFDFSREEPPPDAIQLDLFGFG
jgi:hypothetical protein